MTEVTWPAELVCDSFARDISAGDDLCTARMRPLSFGMIASIPVSPSSRCGGSLRGINIARCGQTPVDRTNIGNPNTARPPIIEKCDEATVCTLHSTRAARAVMR